MLSNCFRYHNPLLLINDLISAKQNKNEKLVYNINNGLTELRNNINRKKFLKMKTGKN